ncbi:hypothetical protein Tco_0710854 [Tanacetum coccineum]
MKPIPQLPSIRTPLFPTTTPTSNAAIFASQKAPPTLLLYTKDQDCNPEGIKMKTKMRDDAYDQRDFSIYVCNMFDTGQAIRMRCRSLHGSIEYRNQGEEHTLSFEVMEKPKLSRFRSWNMRKRRRDVTLLNKAYGKSIGSDRFEVGKWEKRTVKSRDGKLELQTEIFLATIDQMKMDQQKWRNLCKEEAHKDKFIDHHFDLDTVIQAQVRPLEVVFEKSYVDFFRLENTNEKDPLQDAMSFDSIWEEIQNGESTSEECVYIVSWNDHFFVLKKEKNTMYIIDTLGERLTEGCDKAYILKFNEESMIHNIEPKTKIPKAESEGLHNDSSVIREQHKKENNSGIVCKGTSYCKEIIKGILASIPLGELQSKVERGINGDTPLHQLLQIEFHYVSPLQQKLFGPSVVVLLRGHCKQRVYIKHQTCQVCILKTGEAYPELTLADKVDIVDRVFEQKVQDFLELLKKREHLDVLQESEEARILNEVEANQKRIKKDLEKQHVLRQKVDNLINQNHLFKHSIILIKAWCYYERRILGAHHGLISTYALETLVLYNFHVFNNSFAGPPEDDLETKGDVAGKCINGKLTSTVLLNSANGLTNDGVCLYDPEDAEITAYPWDPRVKGLFFHQTTVSIAAVGAGLTETKMAKRT